MLSAQKSLAKGMESSVQQGRREDLIPQACFSFPSHLVFLQGLIHAPVNFRSKHYYVDHAD